MKPVAIDLCCGLGGWAEGLLAEGYEVIGYDTEAHDYGTGGYPGKLILQDITTLHGSQFKHAALIVASPPCQKYSYMAMPWSLGKAKAAAIEADESGAARRELNLLFDTCFRLQREASEAAGHHIPMIVENVRGAQKWVGRAKWNYGSFYLWGDVPALMPMTFMGVKTSGRSMSKDAAAKWGTHNMGTGVEMMAELDGVKHDGSGWQENGCLKSSNRMVSGLKVPGIKLSEVGFNVAAAQRYREGVKQAGISCPRENGKGDRWFQDGAAKHGFRSNSRKAASAMIAKIPFPLSQHIARTFYQVNP